MKQVLQNLRNGETNVVDVPMPAVKPGMALVRTASSLLSAGTERTLVSFASKSLLGKARSRPDLLKQVIEKARREGFLTAISSALTRLHQPVPMGYSSAGTIIELGDQHSQFHLGQRVACAGGGYAVHAEYVVVPYNLLASLPDNVDFESAAFTTLGAIALHGFRLAEVQIGERIAVIGLGLLGLLASKIALAGGIAVLGIDIDPQRVKCAQDRGIEAVLRDQAEEAYQVFSRGRGCDGILICADTTTSDPVELAATIARDRARVVALGAVEQHLPRKLYYEKELTFINSRSYGPGRYDHLYEESGHDYPIGYIRWTEGRNMEAVLDLLANRQLDVKSLISHRFPIEQARLAYELITGAREEPFLGVLLTYDQSEIAPVAQAAANVRFIASQYRTTPAFQPPLESCKLGLLGAGNFANVVLLPAIYKIPNLELIGVASSSGHTAHHTARRFGFRYATSDENQLLNDPQINSVAVLTRHHTHARQIMAALAAGKHVFCEKPLVLTAAELDTIEQQYICTPNDSLELTPSQQPAEEVSSSTDRHVPLLMVGYNRRFAPLARRLLNFVNERKEPLVANYRINAGVVPLNHWVHDPNQGGGRIIGEACHYIDFLTYLIGSPPETVYAALLPDNGRYQQDNVVITFTFPDGSIGNISYLANGDRSFPKERVEVFFGGRVAVLDNFFTLELIHLGKRERFRSILRQDKGYRGEWEAFINAIIASSPPPIPYEHIFGVMRATFAANQSIQSREIVSIIKQ